MFNYKDDQKNTPAGDVNLWTMPMLGPAQQQETPDTEDVSPEQAYERAYQEGLQRGHQEGLALARGDMEGLELQLSSLIQALEAGYNREDRQLLEEMSLMVAATASQIVRAEIELRPELIMKMVAALVADLPDRHHQVTAVLNPEDAEVMSRHMATHASDHQEWNITEDSSLERGDCLLRTDDSVVRADVDKLARQIVMTALEESDVS